MPAPRKGSLITIFVPKPHSSHVFGPHTILGLSGSDLISLQFGHFLYFLPEIWASQNQFAIKLYGDSCFGKYMLFPVFTMFCIKHWAGQSHCLTSNSIETGRHLLFTYVLIVFFVHHIFIRLLVSTTLSSDLCSPPHFHQSCVFQHTSTSCQMQCNSGWQATCFDIHCSSTSQMFAQSNQFQTQTVIGR